MIQVTLALLADSANVSREGKLNIMGIFDRIGAESLPATHPQMHLVMALEADRGDADKDHRLEVELIDAEGTRLLTIAGDLRFTPSPPGEQIRINHVVQLNNLQFTHFGSYDFKILINKEVRKSLPLTVIEARRRGE